MNQRRRQAAAKRHEGNERQARHQAEDRHQHGGDRKRARIATQLIDDGLVGRTDGAAAGYEKASGERDDQRRHLRYETVADGELDEYVGRFADRHAVAEVADDDAAEDVDAGDQQAGDGVTANELGGTVHRAEEGAFLLQLLAAPLRFLLVDDAGRQIGVDRHLLAGDGVKGEARADFRDTRRTLGDDDEVDGDEDQEDDQTDHEVARHDEACKACDDAAGSIVALMAVREDDARRRDVERQPRHRGDQQNGREGREFQGFWIQSATIRISTENAIEKASPMSIRNGGIGRNKTQMMTMMPMAKPISRTLRFDFRKGKCRRLRHIDSVSS
jgi:hypothetical protein